MDKKQKTDLAFFGGQPAFEKALHVGAPNLGNREDLITRINDIYDSMRLTNRGPLVCELEKRLAELLGVRHCIAMCNGTVALEIAIRALGMKGEVILPSFTFIATAHALQWQEVTPVFCDVEPNTYTIDPERIEALITPNTSGIIGVHLWARACRIDALEKIARDNNLKLLFDASHAFSCTYNGQMIGGFGDAEVFSFHATKFFNTFEGGAIVTNNDKLAEKIRFMQNFGFAGRDRVEYLGTNGKMSEVSAAMGLTSLESLNSFIQTNHQHFLRYQSGLSGLPGIRLIPFKDDEKSNRQYVVIEIDEHDFGLSRDQVLKLLESEGILARRYFYPGCHRMEPYRSYFPNAGLLLPETNRISGRVLCLPTGSAVAPEDIDAICGLIRFFHSQSRQIQAGFNTAGLPDEIEIEKSEESYTDVLT